MIACNCEISPNVLLYVHHRFVKSEGGAGKLLVLWLNVWYSDIQQMFSKHIFLNAVILKLYLLCLLVS